MIMIIMIINYYITVALVESRTLTQCSELYLCRLLLVFSHPFYFTLDFPLFCEHISLDSYFHHFNAHCRGN